MTRPRFPAPRYLVLAALAGVAVLGAVFLRDQLSFEALRDNRAALLALRDSHYVLTVAGFIAAYVAIVALSLPGATVATLTGGFLFGTVPGVFYNVAGASLGAVAIFAAARWGFGARLAARMEADPGRVGRLKASLDANQWPMLFLIRLVPVVPFFAANLIPAMVGVALHRFAVSTVFGIIPGALVYTSVGAGLGETFDRGDSPDLGVIFEPHILLPLLGLAALSALPMLIRAVSGRKGI